LNDFDLNLFLSLDDVNEWFEWIIWIHGLNYLNEWMSFTIECMSSGVGLWSWDMLLLKVSSSILLGANLGGLILLVKKIWMYVYGGKIKEGRCMYVGVLPLLSVTSEKWHLSAAGVNKINQHCYNDN